MNDTFIYMRKKIGILSMLVLGILCIGYGSVEIFTHSSTLSLATHSDRNALMAAAANSTEAENDQLIIEPNDGTKTVLSLINSASQSIDLVIYELSDPDIEDALSAASKRGVTVRVLLNQGYYGVPSKSNTNQDAYDYLQSHGVEVHWTPSSFALTHQKSLSIDGKTALIMTFNLDPQYYATSRDFGVLDYDSEDIRAIDSTFNADWANTPLLTNSGDDLVWSPGSTAAILSIINGAKATIDVYNEEMSSEDVVQALSAAEKRGVKVRVIMTYSSKWKSDFTQLAAAGVAIETFKDSKKSPVYIHAKTIISDTSFVFLGSENFSSSSLTKNRELGLLILNPTIANSIESVFGNDWAQAESFSS
jgi:cardiolipin synthase